MGMPPCAPVSGPVRNAQSQVGNPLPVAIDLEHGRHPPQVRGHRLVSQDAQAFDLDVNFPSIRVFFLGFQLTDQIKPSFADRLDAFLQGIDDGGSQRKEVGPERVLVPRRMATEVTRPAAGLEDWPVESRLSGAMPVSLARGDLPDPVEEMRGESTCRINSSRPAPSMQGHDPTTQVHETVIVTLELDEKNPLKHPKSRLQSSQVLLTRRRMKVERRSDLTLHHVDGAGATEVMLKQEDLHCRRRPAGSLPVKQGSLKPGDSKTCPSHRRERASVHLHSNPDRGRGIGSDVRPDRSGNACPGP